jgi:hypothetical protein
MGNSAEVSQSQMSKYESQFLKAPETVSHKDWQLKKQVEKACSIFCPPEEALVLGTPYRNPSLLSFSRYYVEPLQIIPPTPAISEPSPSPRPSFSTLVRPRRQEETTYHSGRESLAQSWKPDSALLNAHPRHVVVNIDCRSRWRPVLPSDWFCKVLQPRKRLYRHELPWPMITFRCHRSGWSQLVSACRHDICSPTQPSRLTNPKPDPASLDFVGKAWHRLSRWRQRIPSACKAAQWILPTARALLAEVYRSTELGFA